MTSSGPIDRTSSRFRVLVTAVTCPPSAFAIWTANVPTPPPAPWMRTRVPGVTWPRSRSPCSAVRAATPIAPACANDSCGGFGTRRSSLAIANSANVPRAVPKTASPGRSRVTSLPTASMCPDRSAPRIGKVGWRRRKPTALTSRPPCTVCQSRALTEAARTRTRTRSSGRSGRWMSRRCSTSAEPLPSWTMAFIGSSPSLGTSVAGGCAESVNGARGADRSAPLIAKTGRASSVGRGGRERAGRSRGRELDPPPWRAEDRQEVAVEADVTGCLPREDQEKAEEEEHRVGARGAGEQVVEVHERAADGGEAHEGAEDQAEPDCHLAERDELAEEVLPVVGDQELDEAVVPVVRDDWLGRRDRGGRDALPEGVDA